MGTTAYCPDAAGNCYTSLKVGKCIHVIRKSLVPSCHVGSRADMNNSLLCPVGLIPSKSLVVPIHFA